jgi:hypothetical protein
MDIRPVSDPSTVTKMQQMARAQFLLGTVEMLGAVGGDTREVLRRVYEAADVDDIDKLLPEPKPNPMAEMAVQLQAGEKQAGIADKQASAALKAVQAQKVAADMQIDPFKVQLQAAKDQGAQQIDAARLELEALEAGRNAA